MLPGIARGRIVIDPMYAGYRIQDGMEENNAPNLKLVCTLFVLPVIVLGFVPCLFFP